MVDNKERYLAFAYTGDAIVADHLKKMKIARGYGTTLPEGTHLAFFLLGAGKRTNAMQRVIDEYNAIEKTTKAKPIQIAKFAECGVVDMDMHCLKLDDSLKHPIVRRIDADMRANVLATWSYPERFGSIILTAQGGKAVAVCEDAEVPVKKAKAQTKKGVVPVSAVDAKPKAPPASVVNEKFIKNIIQSLQIDARHISSLKLRTVVNDISDQVYEVFGEVLTLGTVHHDFVLEQVKIAFRSESVYGVMPVDPKRGSFPEAMWDISGGQAIKYNGTTLVEAKDRSVRDSVGVPNQATLDFFAANLEKWSGMLMEDGVTPVATVNFTVAQFLFFMNGNQPIGVYTSSCVRAFLSALVNAGAIVRNPASGRGRHQAYIARLAELRVFLESASKK